MRFIVDSLVALMLVGLAMGAFLHFRSQRGTGQKIALAQQELDRFQQQVHLQATVGDVERTSAGYPTTVKPEWFGDDLPMNPLLSRGHPWVEIAAESQAELGHPVDRAASDHTTAQFWYNPYRGVVRARVPAGATDGQTLRLYNDVNGSSLTSLYASGDSGKR
jgi:hypothetical protein